MFTNMMFIAFQSKTLHKEEPTMSEAEKFVRRKVEQKAQYMQKRKTTELAERKTAEMSDKPGTSKGGPAKVL